MTTVITFHSPKSAGATVTALNTALLLAHHNPLGKIALIQLSPYSDLPPYLKLEGHKHWGDLLPFAGTKEATLANLKKGAYPLAADIFCSPPPELWSEIKVEGFTPFWNWLAESYDTVVVDLSRGIGASFHTFLTEAATQHLLVTTVDPVSLKAVKTYFDHHQALQKKTQFILNQCPKDGQAFVKRQLDKNTMPCFGILPLDERAMWHQLFEGFPAAYQKKSGFTKALQGLIANFERA